MTQMTHTATIRDGIGSGATRARFGMRQVLTVGGPTNA